jgi:hypothetical protein
MTVEITKKQTEFWVFILVMCIAVSCAVLLVDFGIKAAILEESTRLRLVIEDEEVRRSGRKRAEADANRATNDAPDDASIPGNVLVVQPARMEAGGSANGTEKQVPSPRVRRPKSGRPATDRTVSEGN